MWNFENSPNWIIFMLVWTFHYLQNCKKNHSIQNDFRIFFRSFFSILTLSLPEFILRQSQFLYPLFTFSTFCHLLNCIEFQGLILADDSWNNHLFIRKKSILQFVPCNGKVDSKPSDVCIVSVFNTHWNVLLSRQLH